MSKVLVGEGGKTPGGSSNLGLVMRCPKAYQFQEVRGIYIPRQQVPAHFAVGIIFAAMRRVYFGSNFKTDAETWKKMRQAAQRDAEADNLPVAAEDIARAEALMSSYITYWSLRPRPKPIAAELLLGPVRLSKDDPPEMTRTARLDDLSVYPEAGNKLCIGEAKTTSSDIGSVIREYELHPQPYLYRAVYDASKKGRLKYGEVAGVVLDVTQKDPFRSQRVFVEIRKQALEDFIKSARFYTRFAHEIQWDSDMLRTYRCTTMHGRMRVDCEFKDLCRFGSSAAGKYVLADGSSLRKHKPCEGKERMPWE